MACKTIDGQVVRRQDRELAQLLDKFVCVRVVQMWEADLSLFQFHGQLTWACFFLNADRTIYGRYGSRGAYGGSGFRNNDRDVSIPGLKAAMKAALELHEKYPGNKDSLAGKTGPKPLAPTPEKLPGASGMNLRKVDAANTKGCVHCHQVQDAEYQTVKRQGGTITDKLLWTYPMPDILGISLDPRSRAKVAKVASKSAAAKAGFRRGDEIETMAGQPIISIADVQWVLHQADEPSSIDVEVKRRGKIAKLTLELTKGWRRNGYAFAGNLSLGWITRNQIAGMTMSELNPGEKARLGIKPTGFALKVERIAPGFARNRNQSAARIGLKKNDILVEVDGNRDRMTESEFLAWLIQEKSGSQLPLKYVRGGKLNQATLSVP